MIRNAGGSWKVLSTEFKIRWRGIVRESRKNICPPTPLGQSLISKSGPQVWVGERGMGIVCESRKNTSPYPFGSNGKSMRIRS